jgi:separase
MQQSKIFAHQGLLQEAVYVAEQGEKVATAVQSRSLIIDNASCRAEYWVQGGRVDKAQTTLVVCDQHLGYQHVVMAGYYSALARICHSEARFDDEMAAYNKSEALLAGLSSPSFIRKMIIFSTGADSLSEKLSKISLDDSAPKGKAPTRTTRGRKPTAKAVPKASSKVASRAMPKPPSTLTQRDTTPSTSIADECPSLSSLQADVLRRKALVHLLQDKIPKACELLAQAQALERTVEQSVSHLWTSFKASLSQSMRQLATDFTFNTLPESTIAFPAIQPSEESVQKRADITVAAVKGTKGKKLAKDDFITTLREARERLIESHNLCAHIGSSASFQQASFALAHVTVVLSAVSSGDFRGSLHPLYAAYMSGMFISKQ